MGIELVEGFDDEIGSRFEGAIVARERSVKGEAITLKDDVHGFAVVVGDQSEFETAIFKGMNKLGCAFIYGGLFGGFSLG